MESIEWRQIFEIMTFPIIFQKFIRLSNQIPQ